MAYFQVHSPRGFWTIQNGGELAALYCFAFLYLSAAGGGRGAWIPSGGAELRLKETMKIAPGCERWQGSSFQTFRSLSKYPRTPRLPTPQGCSEEHYENSVCNYCGAVVGRYFRVRAGRAGHSIMEADSHAFNAPGQDWAKQRADKSPRRKEWVSVKSGGRTVKAFLVYPEVKGSKPRPLSSSMRSWG